MEAGPSFSGIGLIISDNISELPIFPIAHPSIPADTENLVSFFANIAQPHHVLHDGFHILTSDYAVLDLSQYFSPPIVPNTMIDRGKPFGGRYLAALFGSALPSVQYTGIASDGFGRAVFAGGQEVFFERDYRA